MLPDGVSLKHTIYRGDAQNSFENGNKIGKETCSSQTKQKVQLRIRLKSFKIIGATLDD